MTPLSCLDGPSPAIDIQAPRSGQARSSFASDDLLQQLCMGRLHAWLSPCPSAEPETVRLTAAKVFDYDADLVRVADQALLRLEYKWDRYLPYRWAAEILSKDRGAGAALGYLFKQTYDWLVYGFVKTGDLYFFEAQAARKFAFAYWKAGQFRATHCANANRDGTAAWNLLVPVQDTYQMLAPHGLAFRAQVPTTLFASSDALPYGQAAETQRQALLQLLASLPDARRCSPWRPSATQHWPGLLEHMTLQNARRATFKAHEIAKSELLTRDWVGLAQSQGLMRD